MSVPEGNSSLYLSGAFDKRIRRLLSYWMNDPTNSPQESVFKMSREEAISRGLTLDLSLPNTKTFLTCRKYFGPHAYLSISQRAHEVLKEAIVDSDERLTLDTLVLGLCLATKRCAYGKKPPESPTNTPNDFLFPFTVFSQRLGSFEFLFRCITKFEANYRIKAVTIFHICDR